jgi:hypothetical protein
MGKKVYTVERHQYIVDDETGKVKEVLVKDTRACSHYVKGYKYRPAK